jgi:hypothetical protein
MAARYYRPAMTPKKVHDLGFRIARLTLARRVAVSDGNKES